MGAYWFVAIALVAVVIAILIRARSKALPLLKATDEGAPIVRHQAQTVVCEIAWN